MSQLDNKTAEVVEDVIKTPSATNKYEKMKEELIKRLSTSQEQRIKRLLEHEEIGDKTPSQFLRHLRNLAGVTVPDNFLQTLWANRLPSPMQAILATQTGASLEKIAELADKINKTSPALHVAQVSTSSKVGQLRELKLSIAELTQQRGRTQNRHVSRSKTRSRNRDINQRREEENQCWYHRRFGEKAKKCTAPYQHAGNANNRL